MPIEIRECATLGTFFRDIWKDGELWASEVDSDVAQFLIDNPGLQNGTAFCSTDVLRRLVLLWEYQRFTSLNALKWEETCPGEEWSLYNGIHLIARVTYWPKTSRRKRDRYDVDVYWPGIHGKRAKEIRGEEPEPTSLEEAKRLVAAMAVRCGAIRRI